MDSAGLAVLVVSDALNSLSYFPWVIVCEMVLDFPLVSMA